MAEFENLDRDVRRRLEERGINVEQSYALFQAEIRVHPPPLLLAHLRIDDFSKWPKQQDRSIDDKQRRRKGGRAASASEETIADLYREYKTGKSVPELATRWEELGYKNEKSCMDAIYSLFHTRGMTLRSKQDSARLRVKKDDNAEH